MTSIIEHLGTSPGLAQFTCDGCGSVFENPAHLATQCLIFGRNLKVNEAGSPLRCAECLLNGRDELGD